MATAIVLFIVVLGFLVAAHYLCDKVVAERHLEGHEGMVAAMLGVVGTLFALLLGLLVANSVQDYHDLKATSSNEANAIGNIYRISRAIDNDESRARIGQLCTDYTAAVVDTEWALMKSQQTCPKAWEDYQDLWNAVSGFSPVGDRENNLQSAMLSSMQVLGETRRQRAVACTSSLSLPLWIAIGFGSASTLIFAYFFIRRRMKLSVIVTSLVAFSLMLNVWLLDAYSSPYSGDLQIQPDMFRLVRKQVLAAPDFKCPLLKGKRSASETKEL